MPPSLHKDLGLIGYLTCLWDLPQKKVRRTVTVPRTRPKRAAQQHMAGAPYAGRSSNRCLWRKGHYAQVGCFRGSSLDACKLFSVCPWPRVLYGSPIRSFLSGNRSCPPVPPDETPGGKRPQYIRKKLQAARVWYRLRHGCRSCRHGGSSLPSHSPPISRPSRNVLQFAAADPDVADRNDLCDRVTQSAPNILGVIWEVGNEYATST